MKRMAKRMASQAPTTIKKRKRPRPLLLRRLPGDLGPKVLHANGPGPGTSGEGRGPGAATGAGGGPRTETATVETGPDLESVTVGPGPRTGSAGPKAETEKPVTVVVRATRNRRISQLLLLQLLLHPPKTR